MVFFTCSHCGESVKKPSVSKHYETKCRNKPPFLTCVDCLKDFKGAEYEAHTKCVTEEERYSAKGFVPKPSQNKGERKQQAWQECIQTVLKKTTLKQDERDLIKAISKYENVPRKKAKFQNFLSNAFKQYANKTDLIDRVWTEMETVFKELSAKEKQQQEKEKKSEQENENQGAVQKPSEEGEANAVKKEKKRKRKAEENKVVEASESSVVAEKSKKKKTKHGEENGVEGNSEASPTNGAGDQQKKSRKRKAGDGEVEQNGVVAEEAESEKKKKKKKNDKLAENQVNGGSEQCTDAVSKTKKKNKKKNEKPESSAGEGETVPVETGSGKPGKKEKKEKKSENKENCVGKAAEVSSEGGAKTDKPVPKKKKAGDDDGDKQEAFDWKATILQVINKEGKDKKIQLQKLQKRVLKLHCQILKCESSGKKEKKFMKKLKEIPQIEVNENMVVLQS